MARNPAARNPSAMLAPNAVTRSGGADAENMLGIIVDTNSTGGISEASRLAANRRRTVSAGNEPAHPAYAPARKRPRTSAR